jgi:hypothetical protein
MLDRMFLAPWIGLPAALLEASECSDKPDHTGIIGFVVPACADENEVQTVGLQTRERRSPDRLMILVASRRV